MSTGYPVPSDDRSAEWREQVRRLSDLCKRDGALFAAVVRETDRLHALGLTQHAAYSEAWEQLVGSSQERQKPPSP